MIYYVSNDGNDNNPATRERPLRTISRAAELAQPGDTVRVFSGLYREWVSPPRGGNDESSRITYEPADDGRPIIKGSDVITDWERVSGTVWKKEIDNSYFGNFNPFSEMLYGDWLVEPENKLHLAEVYINGRALFEALDTHELYSDEMRSLGFQGKGDTLPTPIAEPERSLYRWYAENDGEKTTILCNFRNFDPNSSLVEITVRPACFYPEKTGINYITVRGFEMAQAACSWAPPTAEQNAIIGPHYAKGWVIEDNVIHDAKCCGISLGKDSSSGQNEHTLYQRKSGHRYQLECVYRAFLGGWSRETVGSHTVRDNHVYDCGQAGIVGHLGCVFSRIEHNHIHDIGKRCEFWGHEMAGIKLHAAIDTVIANNNIHGCTLGIWLDWQAQGTRVTRNLMHENKRDMMLEVTHGPCLVDNNIFMSRFSLHNLAEGTAYVHNMFLGGTLLEPVKNRCTPYHHPHSTTPLGYAETLAGDDRVYNNIFLGAYDTEGISRPRAFRQFTACYDAFSAPDEYRDALAAHGILGVVAFTETPQPVWIGGNVYSGLAECGRLETRGLRAEGFTASLRCDGERWILDMRVPDEVSAFECALIDTDTLGRPRMVEQAYEDPDGKPISVDCDINGNSRGRIIAGPFATLSGGDESIIVWK